MVVVRDHQAVVGEILDGHELREVGHQLAAIPALRDAKWNVDGVQDVSDGLNSIGASGRLRRVVTRRRPRTDRAGGSSLPRCRWFAALAQRRDVRRTDLLALHAHGGEVRNSEGSAGASHKSAHL